jgi:hypothetical protein
MSTVVGECHDMRGRKHPLEIFRQNGDEFLTLRNGQEAARRSAKPVREEREPPREAEEPAAASPPPGKKAKREIVMARSGAVQRRAAGGGRRVGRWLFALGGLVLVAGLAYAVKLRFFRGSGAPSSHDVTLQRDEAIQSKWPDHALPQQAGESPAAGRESSVGDAAAAGKSPKEAAAKAPPKASEKKREYWIVVASVKLSEQERGKNVAELRKELFKNEEQKLHRGLDAEIDRLGFRVQTVAINQKAGEYVLRVGCGASADDPNLKALLAKVAGLGGTFKKATIRDYPPAATK